MSPSKHQNAFDLFRLILASAVVYTHSFLLGGFGTEGFLDFNKGQTIAGRVAVLGFFGLSGYLVTASFIKRNSPASYLWSRIKRIFPAFCASFSWFMVERRFLFSQRTKGPTPS